MSAPTASTIASEALGLYGQYDVVEWDVGYLRSLYPRWEQLPAMVKHRLRFAHPEAALSAETVSNLVVDAYLESLVDGLDPAQTDTAVEASHIAVGTGTASPSGGDTILSNEVFRTGIDGSSDGGTNISVTATLGGGDANGNTLTEVAAFNNANTDSGTMVNHALFSEAKEKNSSKELTITVSLFFGDF